MTRFTCPHLWVLLPLLCLATSPNGTHAAFHLWDITEVYSNADGSVQFLELFATANSQQFLSGHTITSGANTFTFPSNSPSPTAQHHLLIATAGFGSLPGGVTADFTLPANFFNPASDTINFANSDTAVFTSAPTDGILSLNYAFGSNTATIMTNSPTNYAGQAGSIGGSDIVPGDYNNDGSVDAADYTLWRDNLGTGFDLGGNGEESGGSAGVVDQADYVLWRDNYGTTAASLSATLSAPEPAALLLAPAGLALGRLRRSRQPT